MKNSLELELQLKIKRANRFLSARQYPEAIKQYTQGLDLYQSNRRFNATVSQQFESLLYSLRGNTYSLNLNSEEAEGDFIKSLKGNPYSSITLSRRAKHLMKEKRYSEAVQDIDLALLYDPENLSYQSLLNSIQSYANEMKDETEKSHISELIANVKARLNAKPPTQSQSDSDENDEQMLNFSKLRNIDRVSIKICPKSQNRKSVIQFRQDQILQYDDDEDEVEYFGRFKNIPSETEIIQKLKQQQLQLQELQKQEEQRQTPQINILQPERIILTKTHERSRKSILRKSNINQNQALFISMPNQKSSFARKSRVSVLAVKNIDGKLVSHQIQAIKFKPRQSELSKSSLGNICEIPVFENKQNLSLTVPKNQGRKSCLRSSKLSNTSITEELSKTLPSRKSSNFLNIKSIDGEYQKKQSFAGSQIDGPVLIQIQTDSDDDNQHNIFGVKSKEVKSKEIKSKEVLKMCENIQEVPTTIEKKLSKKKSILKKDSFIDSSLMMSWKSQKKKSVLFRTE